MSICHVGEFIFASVKLIFIVFNSIGLQVFINWFISEHIYVFNLLLMTVFWNCLFVLPRYTIFCIL